ncbi:FAD-dependent monooxygenase [Phytoactinopolyspora limicola]|uniref:FAD-dependent monooxygenase n=1 Tax=Phytoactinopolyspora limicola TaxID=2715536 RepID=UPI001FE93714|nr:FAD-dependent monooxygenase [Phytoactinopolyspora limicola]
MTTLMNRRVLISGASVAGLTLAYWLRQHGFDVTVVEKAPAVRPGGQALDVRGTALDVARRMGVLADLRLARTDMQGMSMVDGSGRELHRTTHETLSGGALDGDDVEVLRDDLCDLLLDAARDDVEYLFGDAVTSVIQDDDGVHVGFETGSERRFDLLVGADGLRSAVRRLTFGPDAGFVHHLGSYVGVFTAPNTLDLDRWQVWIQADDGSGGVVMSARDNTETRVYLGFPSELIHYNYRDVDAQKHLFAGRLAHLGWEVPRLLTHMWDAPDFHFDAMSQVRMGTWTAGRITLVGDAGYAGSPLSGQGTSVAMVGAYLLAAELAAAGGDHRAAFDGYERRMRGWVGQNQALALVNGARLKAEGEGRDPSSIEGPVMDDVKHAISLDVMPATARWRG